MTGHRMSVAMKFRSFSKKQLAALSWWCDTSPHRGRDGIICDGAVRSGKTLCLSVSFVLWAHSRFEGSTFALCGKTVTSLRRNLVRPMTAALASMGFSCDEKVSKSFIDIARGGRCNRFYLFGGRDEGSAALIQGITLCGILFDEVALMPRSFVEQGLARCSQSGSTFWFNCNPQHPRHWFYTEWIARAKEKNALYLHFRMEDNPALSPAIIARYRALYTGAFYERYVLGRWTAVSGAVYPMFSEEKHVVEKMPHCGRFVISCDYGTANPSSFGLWGESGGVWYRMREFYHNSRESGVMMTDEEYADALEELAGGRAVEAVVVDPSAASFIQCLRRRGKMRVVAADNRVMDGIRLVASALKEGKMLFHKDCNDAIREFSLYRWDFAAAGDAPVKENDHAMDDIRYFATYAFRGGGQSGFFACSVARS